MLWNSISKMQPLEFTYKTGEVGEPQLSLRKNKCLFLRHRKADSDILKISLSAVFLPKFLRPQAQLRLFHSNRFSKVARLINIAAFVRSNVISEKLQRHNRERGEKHFVCFGDFDNVIRNVLHILV